MPRSGSTFSFNIAREILSQRIPTTCKVTEDIYDAITGSNTRCLIIKNHNLNEFGINLLKIDAMKGICTIRDPYEAIESTMDIFGFDIDQSIHSFQLWVDSFNQFHEMSLIISFKNIEQSPTRTVWRISKYLGFTPSPLELYKLVKKYNKKSIMKISHEIDPRDKHVTDVGFSYYNNENLFHRRHVRKEKNKSLSNAEIQHIKNSLHNLDILHTYL